MYHLINDRGIKFKHNMNQICLNTTPDRPDDVYYGCGSLVYDWDNVEIVIDDQGKEKHIPPKRDIPLQEENFTVFNNQFKGTCFDTMYYWLNTHYHLGRVRLMKMDPTKCLSWHRDTSKRIHYPIDTHIGNMMIIEDEVKHMPENTWWFTDTTNLHTALNASPQSRVHLVAVILGKK